MFKLYDYIDLDLNCNERLATDACDEVTLSKVHIKCKKYLRDLYYSSGDDI